MLIAGTARPLPEGRGSRAHVKTFRMALNPGAVVCLCKEGSAGVRAVQAYHVERIVLDSGRLRWTIADGSGGVVEGGHGAEALHPRLTVKPAAPLQCRPAPRGVRAVFELTTPADHFVWHLAHLRRTRPKALEGLRLAG